MTWPPVWVQVYLSGARWGALGGVAFGWLYAGLVATWIDGSSNGADWFVAFVFLGAIFGTIPGAILGLGVGTVVGLIAGTLLHNLLRLMGPARAVLWTYAVVMGLQLAVIGVLAVHETTNLTYLPVLAIEAVPLLRTLRRVARDSAEPAAYSHRRDTLAA